MEPYVTRDSLRRMAAAIRRFERALAADGVDSRNLAANLRLLESSFSSHNFTFHQYQNVFQFIVGSVTELSRTSILSHDQVLHTVLKHDPRQCEVRCMSLDAVAEMVLREVLVSALGMQTLDRYMSAVLRQISTLTGRLSNTALTRMMNYDPERLVSRIHEAKPAHRRPDDPGLQGPGPQADGLLQAPGARRASSSPPSSSAPCPPWPTGRSSTTRSTGCAGAIGDLEKETGLRLGDPSRLLTLSIRSGAAISMPGLMTTFVDVGLNDKLAEALSRKPGFEWAAWDSYRRFLQTWAMASGIDRDFFDAIMTEFKARYGMERKLGLPAGAHARAGLRLQEPGRGSWGCGSPTTPSARWWPASARCSAPGIRPRPSSTGSYLGVAEEWGTAVVVQRMVFGNLSRESGSGVTFTRNPLEPHSSQVRLFGDFTARSQGEDLVGGLVFPWPISEAQRLGSPTYRGIEHSLEKDHPGVYQALLEVARDLVGKREHDPQEIEFTFESDVRQGPVHPAEAGHGARADTTTPRTSTPSSPQFGPPVGRGHGRGRRRLLGTGGHRTWHQIDRLLAETPGEPIVLLRPDTVPEDIAMITRVVGTADRPRRGHLARGRHRQAPGQDRRGRLPGPGGGRAPGHRPPGRARAQGGRLALHRRPHREHLPGPHPHHRAGAIASRQEHQGVTYRHRHAQPACSGKSPVVVLEGSCSRPREGSYQRRKDRMMAAPRTLGINGLGRIGKLTLWYHLAHDDFDRFVVNVGRPVGTSLQSVARVPRQGQHLRPAASLSRRLHRPAATCRSSTRRKGLCTIHGKEVVFLRDARNPKDIPWRDHGVAAGGRLHRQVPRSRTPTPTTRKGALRGHLAAGARAVVHSSPFKSKVKGVPLPDDAAILIHGINHLDYDPGKHKIVSAASCTTTGLAHMMRPLLARDLTRNMITAGMSTIHAVTNSQPVLDAVPARRCHRPAQDPLGPWTTSSSPPPTPPRPWSRSCPRSPASASWPTRCASPPPPSA